jgi:hypothetical protein
MPEQPHPSPERDVVALSRHARATTTSSSVATTSWSATTEPSNVDANELCQGLLSVDLCSFEPCLHHAGVRVNADT